MTRSRHAVAKKETRKSTGRKAGGRKKAAGRMVGSIIAGVNTLWVNGTGRIFVGTSRAAWDWAFSKIANCGVVVELTDGGEIAGSFYDAAGVSAHPYDEAIYLDCLWERDGSTGAFASPFAGSKGCYVHGSRIRALRFYALPAIAATERS